MLLVCVRGGEGDGVSVSGCWFKGYLRPEHKLALPPVHFFDLGYRILALKPLTLPSYSSGTLSYIFNTFGDGRSFSEIVNEAKSKGYTEPDPRDDLNGTDVARKVGVMRPEKGV